MRRGFSIAECLIAAVLLCGMAVALFGVWAMHAKASAQSREAMVATFWGEQVMEEKLSQGYTVKSDLYANPPFVAKHIVDGQDVQTLFYYRTYVADNPTPTNPGLKTITVEVAWEHAGSWKSVRLLTRLGWQG
ncbi:hypothetical protein JST97_16205 [bacterium]|nr:hypothetical protein [bacterium]